MTYQSLEGLMFRDANPDDALCLSVLAMQVFLDTYAPPGHPPRNSPRSAVFLFASGIRSIHR